MKKRLPVCCCRRRCALFYVFKRPRSCILVGREISFVLSSLVRKRKKQVLLLSTPDWNSPLSDHRPDRRSWQPGLSASHKRLVTQLQYWTLPKNSVYQRRPLVGHWFLSNTSRLDTKEVVKKMGIEPGRSQPSLSRNQATQVAVQRINISPSLTGKPSRSAEPSAIDYCFFFAFARHKRRTSIFCSLVVVALFYVWDRPYIYGCIGRALPAARVDIVDKAFLRKLFPRTSTNGVVVTC
jgi:hypothetical protein